MKLQSLICIAAIMLATTSIAAVNDDEQIQIVKLRYVSAEDVADVISPMVGASISVDQRTNSLLVVANENQFEELMRLIQELDVQVDEPEETDLVRVYRIQHSVAEDIAGSLGNLFRQQSARAGHRNVQIAVDHGTNSVVVRGTAEQLSRVEDVIVALDVPGEMVGTSSSAEMNVRLIWLVSGVERTIPHDLGPVVDELERLGITDLGLAGQSMLRTQDDTEFETGFAVQIDEPWRIAMQGFAMIATEGRREIAVDINASPESARRQQPTRGGNNPTPSLAAIDLRTKVTTPEGHYIVLGVTPILNRDAAFVLQVLDVD